MSIFSDEQMGVLRAGFERQLGALNPTKVGQPWFLKWNGEGYDDQRTQDMWHGWRLCCLALVTPPDEDLL